MKRLLFFSAFLFVLFSCGKEIDPAPGVNNPNTTSSNGWLIPRGDVQDGGPGKDGIPSVDEPKFESITAADYMTDFDLILTIHKDGAQHSYPHPVLDWHEIVNDEVGNTAVTITYCPLTGTGTAWDRTLNGVKTTFGVSGLLYRNNLIPYDRKTGSNWSQMRLDCVNGELAGEQVVTYPMVEMSWTTFKKLFPQEQVLSTDTGSNRNYGRYPYGAYRTNHDLIIFPVGQEDSRLPAKERVLAVEVADKARVYRFGTFQSGLDVISDSFGGVDLVVFGSLQDNIMMAYQAQIGDGTKLEFVAEEALLEGGVVMSDQLGNKWNIFGRAVEGPMAGQELVPVTTSMGYWFAFGAFYDQLEIYE